MDSLSSAVESETEMARPSFHVVSVGIIGKPEKRAFNIRGIPKLIHDDRYSISMPLGQDVLE